jgi:hypothetical protein
LNISVDIDLQHGKIVIDFAAGVEVDIVREIVDWLSYNASQSDSYDIRKLGLAFDKAQERSRTASTANSKSAKGGAAPPALAQKIIHVNRNRLLSNVKRDLNDPPICVRTYRSGKNVYYGHNVKWNAPSEMNYDKECKLDCGAKIWVAVNGEVVIDGVKVV